MTLRYSSSFPSCSVTPLLPPHCLRHGNPLAERRQAPLPPAATRRGPRAGLSFTHEPGTVPVSQSTAATATTVTPSAPVRCRVVLVARTVLHRPISRRHASLAGGRPPGRPVDATTSAPAPRHAAARTPGEAPTHVLSPVQTRPTAGCPAPASAPTATQAATEAPAQTSGVAPRPAPTRTPPSDLGIGPPRTD